MANRSIDEFLAEYQNNPALAHVAKAIELKGHVMRWQHQDQTLEVSIVSDADAATLQWKRSKPSNVMVRHYSYFDTMSDRLSMLEYYEYNPTTEKVNCLYSSGYE